MAEGRSYWNMAAETKLNTPEMKEIQFQKIRKKMEYLYNGTSFWRSWWDKAGVKPEQVKTWDDYYKRVPVYTKDDYRVYAEECDGDMSRIVDGLLGADSRRLKCLAATSGTTGAPTPYPLTPEDMEVWSEFLKRAFWRSGIFPGDRILHGMGLS
ncbi:MAG: GH3 auxin-responsive promoter family protein, partial [SAR324 cluster bacterium]|nr:GH3 auxin-responsive promoter family protein [SAR324 cluster bacterium]